MKAILITIALTLLPSALLCTVVAQTPTIFDISDVVVGASRTPTRYLFAVGKWSDAAEHVGVSSTNIECYKKLGFCQVANAYSYGGDADVMLDSYDILRWDDREIIAVDSSPACIVNNLRVDITDKKISMSTTGKGNKSAVCQDLEKAPTAYLIGRDDIMKAIQERKK